MGGGGGGGGGKGGGGGGGRRKEVHLWERSLFFVSFRSIVARIREERRVGRMEERGNLLASWKHVSLFLLLFFFFLSSRFFLSSSDRCAPRTHRYFVSSFFFCFRLFFPCAEENGRDEGKMEAGDPEKGSSSSSPLSPKFVGKFNFSLLYERELLLEIIIFSRFIFVLRQRNLFKIRLKIRKVILEIKSFILILRG